MPPGKLGQLRIAWMHLTVPVQLSVVLPQSIDTEQVESSEATSEGELDRLFRNSSLESAKAPPDESDRKARNAEAASKT